MAADLPNAVWLLPRLEEGVSSLAHGIEKIG